MDAIHLTHHYVRTNPAPGSTSTPERLEAQISWLQENKYTILSCDELVDRHQRGQSLPERHATITFDDGLKDHLEVAAILSRRGVPATFFCMTGPLEGTLPAVIGLQLLLEAAGVDAIEQEVRGLLTGLYADVMDPKRFDVSDRKMGDPPELRRLKWVFQYLPAGLKRELLQELFPKYLKKSETEYAQERFLSAGEITRLDKMGFEIGSHTISHPPLDALSLSELQVELTSSKRLLSEVIGRYVISFAWPFGGNFHTKAKEIAREYYASAWNYNSKLKAIPENPYADLMDIPRLYEGVMQL